MVNLSIKDLRLSYGSTEILRGISFSSKKGEVVCLLGPSGCGKTTLLRAIAGLESPFGGSISLEGKVLYAADDGINVPAHRRNLGLVFQSYALWPHMTVHDNVAYGLRVRKMANAEISASVEKILADVGLAKLAQRYPHELSGGQQQRVALARALVYNPPFILLDEPLSNLDAKLRDEARLWLRALVERLGISAVCVTHDQDEAMALADQIVLLSDGRIMQQGSPSDLYSTPSSSFSAEFFGVTTTLPGTMRHRADSDFAEVAVDGGALRARVPGDLAHGSEVLVHFRADEIEVAFEPSEYSLEAELTTARYFGNRWEYVFQRKNRSIRVFGKDRRETGTYWLKPTPTQTWAFRK